MSTFLPKPLAVPVVCFSSEFDGRPWRRISPDLRIIRVPGSHYDWVTVHAKALAHYLKDPRVSIATRATTIGELPPLSESISGPDRWDLIDGLSAEAVEKPAVVAGQRILRLVAAGADGRHALGARFGGLAPSECYRAIAWVKAEPGVRVMIEAGRGSLRKVVELRRCSVRSWRSFSRQFDRGHPRQRRGGGCGWLGETMGRSAQQR